MRQRLITLFIYSVTLFIIINISRSIYTLWQKQQILFTQEQIRNQLEKENKDLVEELQQVQSPQFIEKQAREKLNLQRPGETVVILPEELKQFSGLEQPASNEEDLPNWQRWWKLFF